MSEIGNTLSGLLTAVTYTTVLPSTGKKIKYRAYTVSEEQVLLVAKETKDPEIILTNTKTIISQCTFDGVDPDTLASFDIEWLLLQLRGVSVDNIIEIGVPCKNEACESKKTIDMVINIDDIEAPKIKKRENVIELNDNLHVVMRYPGFGVLESITGSDTGIIKILAGLIESIVKGEDVYNASEYSMDDLVDFVGSMNSKTLKKMTDFITECPSIKHSETVKCQVCELESKYDFTGIHNFFS